MAAVTISKADREDDDAAVAEQLRNIREIEKRLEILRQQYRFHAKEVKRLSPKKARETRQSSQLADLGPVFEEQKLVRDAV